MAQDLWGYADLHCHPTAHLAFGGASASERDRLFWGSPDGPIKDALSCCAAGHGLHLGPIPWVMEDVGKRCGEGHGSFKAWPHHKTLVHQQMYVDWVRRAYESGLRVMCALAVNNELLAGIYNSGGDNSDWTAIKAQIADMKRIAADQSAWMQVVGTPDEARAAVVAGKLAVVLGVEVDSLGGWRTPSECDEKKVDGLVESLFQLGVRSVTAIHLANNAFGGCAISGDKFAVLNHWLTRKYLGRVDGFFDIDLAASEAELQGVEFILGCDPEDRVYRNGYPFKLPAYFLMRQDGHVNRESLSAPGAALVRSMMKRGMLIDIDHMSQKSVDATLRIAEETGYPLISSHTSFRELGRKRPLADPNSMLGVRNEGMLTREVLLRLKDLGGMVAPISHLKPIGPVQHATLPDFRVTPDQDTSESWAHGFLYALELLGDRVAIGTDFNGLAQQPGPRFSGLLGANAVQYDRDRIVGTDRLLKRCEAGSRTFDVNADGLAHYGLLPDFLRDVANQYGVDDILMPFYRSASRFIETWERCVAVGGAG